VRRFWKALRLIPGGATSRYDWTYLLQDEWPLVEPLLRSTGTVASRIICPSLGGEGCPRRVLQDENGTRAVCSDPLFDCDEVELTLEDIVVLEVDVGRLAGSLCRSLCCAPDLRALPFGGGATWSMGWYEPIAGDRFDLCLAFPATAEESHTVAVRLVGHLKRPFMLLVPARDVVDPETIEYLRGYRARVLCLEEVLGVDAVGDWQLLSPAEDLLRDFRQDVVGNVRFGMPEHRFPTPPGSSWSDVTIRFINGHEVEPRVRGQGGGVFNYAHMGMAKTNRDEPTVQWDLLRVLAQGRGELPWPRTVRHKTVQKRRERLANHLRGFFGIDGNPFDDLPRRRGFKTRFLIVPER
jgi:hypothetical protein